MNGEFRFLMYRSAEEDVAVNAVIRDETVWLTQKTMAELFGVQPPAINKHLKNRPVHQPCKKGLKSYSLGHE